jgi:MerR family mercuric resistance operon transcriptional regulator
MTPIKRDFILEKISPRTAVSDETIPYYKKIKPLHPPPRIQRWHRLFPNRHLKLLTFIRRSRELELTRAKICNQLSVVEGNFICAERHQSALTHLARIRRKIADLLLMERTLIEKAGCCEGDGALECPIINALLERRHGARSDAQ